jgi:SpoVK/Ycf46/Vps4 family AAA+-type ATPase
MANADQIKALIKSHIDNDTERFVTAALQLASHEARQGHSALAREIHSLIEKAKLPSVKVLPFKRDLDDLVSFSEPSQRLTELIVPDALKERLQRVINEYYQRDKLTKHGLSNRRKLLLSGSPGTGKTLTASVLAKELHLPLYTIQMDRLMTKFMGETASKLRQIFELIQQRQGVFLFDEFDAIGTERGSENEVGEMRRVLNAFLQFLEQDKSESLILAATNTLTALDQALFRRFDDILHYELPTDTEVIQLIENKLGIYKSHFETSQVLAYAKNLSHAEITQACGDAIKETILADKSKVTKERLVSMLKDRQSAYRAMRGN